jgi:hypothetical protein
MKFSPSTLCGVALALLLPLGSTRADLIPWVYSWSTSSTEIHANSPSTGKVTLLIDDSQKSAIGDSDIVAANLKTYSTALPGHADVFTARTYSLSLFLQDSDSGKGGTLTFTGQLDGTLTAKSSNLKNTFTNSTTQELILGDNLYTVNFGPYTPPGPPSSNITGSIGAHTSITVEHLIVSQIPEPTTLVLSGLGMMLLGATHWRARRSRRHFEAGSERQRDAA